MSAVAKVLVVLVLLLSAGFAASQIILYGKREDYGARYLEAAQQLKDTAGKLDDTQKALSDKTTAFDTLKEQTNTEIASLKSGLADETTRVQDLNAQLERITTAVQQLTAANQDQEHRLGVREQTVEQLRTTVSERDQTIKENLDKIDELQNTIAQRNGTIGELTHDLNQTKKTNVELAESEQRLQNTIASLIQRGIEVEPALAPAINGRVIQVDLAMGAAVIDRGTGAGVKPNTQFTIYNDGGYVASLITHQVQDKLSVGKVQMLATGKQVQVGDRVTTEVR